MERLYLFVSPSTTLAVPSAAMANPREVLMSEREFVPSKESSLYELLFLKSAKEAGAGEGSPKFWLAAVRMVRLPALTRNVY